MEKVLIGTALSVLTICSVHAQSGFSGVVSDREAAPVVGAVVIISDSLEREDLYSTYTDSLGRYSVPSVPENFKLNITAFGHTPHSSDVSLGKMTDRMISTTLDWMTVNEVVVRATVNPVMKRDGNKFVVSGIENSPYSKGNNAYTFLRYVPLLKVPPFEGAITVIGGDVASLLVNGRRTNIPMEAFLKNLSADDIERIEIIAHPGSEYSAGTRGSIINIVIKKRQDEGAKYSLFVADGHTGVNRQNGSFGVSYTGKKTYWSSGVILNNSRFRSESSEHYRFYDIDQNIDQESVTKSRNSSASVYLNVDREIDKNNTIGARLSVSGSDTKNSNSMSSNYGRISAGFADSTYYSSYKTTSPSKFTGWNANLNYTLKADDRGSQFMADLDYAFRSPDRRTHNVFDKLLSSGITRENDFTQRERIMVDAFGVSAKYNHVFASGSRLNSGLSLSGGDTGYDYYFANMSDGDYVNDPNRSNYFVYKDITASAYATFQKSWNEKLSSVIGVRFESYHAAGEQQTTGEKRSRHETDIYPSLTLNYAMNDNHSFSVSLARGVDRPNYNELNPFVSYLSPTTYRKGNPDLISGNRWTGGFSYDFFDDYWFNVFFMHVDNIWNEFTIPDGNNRIMLTNINYGKLFFIVPSFSVSKSIFAGYVYVSGDVSYSYRKFKGEAESIDIDIKDGSFDFSINADVTISKKADLSIYGDYSYIQASKSATVFLPVDQNFSLSLKKTFDNSSLSVGVNRSLMPDDKLFFESRDYGYTIHRKNFWSWNASYSLTFGNKSVRNVRDRSNEGISTMLNTL
jgi:hypothetical protein